ncbi:MAG: hypothetical protein NTW30_03780 [Candidatus Aenigmarchaeota archaeon]|nr:hypothetical protein [Candidatus Aenigmarchaeota archaeon]
MIEFNPKEIVESIFKGMNEYHPEVMEFLGQKRFVNLSYLLAIEICEKEIPPPAEHLSLAALSCSRLEGPGVVVDYDVTQMLLNAGIERQEAYLRSKKLAEEIYQTLIRQRFIIKFRQDIGAYQIIDPSKKYPPEDPPQNASYRNGPEVYLLETVVRPRTQSPLYPLTQSLNVTLSKKLDVELAIPFYLR